MYHKRHVRLARIMKPEMTTPATRGIGDEDLSISKKNHNYLAKIWYFIILKLLNTEPILIVIFGYFLSCQ